MFKQGLWQLLRHSAKPQGGASVLVWRAGENGGRSVTLLAAQCWLVWGLELKRLAYHYDALAENMSEVGALQLHVNGNKRHQTSVYSTRPTW